MFNYGNWIILARGSFYVEDEPDVSHVDSNLTQHNVLYSTLLVLYWCKLCQVECGDLINVCASMYWQACDALIGRLSQLFSSVSNTAARRQLQPAPNLT
jgi:hypothetical protein